MKPNPGHSEPNAETRSVILHTARRLFLELGYRAVTTRRIADACGLTQPALYHHFANKQALYVAVHRELLVELRPGLERIARREDPLSEQVTAIVRYLLANRSEDMGLLFHDLQHELDVEARVAVRDLFRDHVVVPIAAVFRNAAQRGDLREMAAGGMSPLAATYLLLSLVASPAHIEDTAQTSFYTAEQYAQMVAEVLLHGLAQPPKPLESKDEVP